MRVACFIPIKAFSERVKGKNFRKIGGKPLFEIIIDKALEAGCFDDVFVDTNSDEISDYAISNGASVIPRKEELALNSANGNDLLLHHRYLKPNYDYYFQLFATAPLMKVDTIKKCVNSLISTSTHDSVFTALKHNGFFWWNSQPVNYQPVVLPRSQDLVPVVEETTAIYGIKKDTLTRYHSRIGATPLIIEVAKAEAIDLNVEEDFDYANWLVERGIAKI
ncbi:acylneuraminate cytidylyltransferase family protein [Flavicella marina]|uniref:acylneuraminate cytidylyltransferase family protein n=1 Tax=Flavicella marina TaxID=1475951 RepID=UPI001263F454|nr:acylneuraminate cytidylyltransferase family protein [Flavicella marina]